MNPPSLPQTITRLALGWMLLLTSGFLSAGTVGPITYRDDGGAITITGYSTDIEGAVVIPETIEGKPVRTIGAYSFLGCNNLTEISIPSGVTRIEEFAFLRCEMVSSFTIPAGLVFIGNGAFMGADQLVSFTIPSGVTQIGSYTFEDCTSLEEVVFPEGVTRIGTYAFGNCTSIESVKLPVTLARIDDHAFSDCMSLDEVTFLGNAPSVGVDVFGYGTTVYFSPSRTGFSLPKWMGYDSAFIPVPIIAVVSEEKRVLKNGKGKQVFDPAKIGKKGEAKIYAIANAGNLNLSGLTLVKTGAHAGDFKIATSRRAATLTPGEYLGLMVRFVPKGKGLRKATLEIRSNDPKNPTFRILLSGQGRK